MGKGDLFPEWHFHDFFLTFSLGKSYKDIVIQPQRKSNQNSSRAQKCREVLSKEVVKPVTCFPRPQHLWNSEFAP